MPCEKIFKLSDMKNRLSMEINWRISVCNGFRQEPPMVYYTLHSANNSEVLLAETKSTSYEALGVKALLNVLGFVRS